MNRGRPTQTPLINLINLTSESNLNRFQINHEPFMNMSISKSPAYCGFYPCQNHIHKFM
jgi:hypothetical protein